MGLAAIGAGIAVLTGLGAGIGIGVATNGALEQSQDSQKKLETSIKHYYLVVH